MMEIDLLRTAVRKGKVMMFDAYCVSWTEARRLDFACHLANEKSGRGVCPFLTSRKRENVDMVAAPYGVEVHDRGICKCNPDT